MPSKKQVSFMRRLCKHPPLSVSPLFLGQGLAARLPTRSGILRPGRFAVLRTLLWLVVLLAALVAILSLQSIVRAVAPYPGLVLAMAFVTVVFAYAAYAALVCRGERRDPSELSFRSLPLELGAGLLVGGNAMAITIGFLVLTGAYHISPGQWSDWGHDVREALGTGFLEELLARLVIFRLLAHAFRVGPGLAISALMFGAAHLANPGASYVSAMAIAVEAGLMLAGFYLLTGRIWVSVGAHAGWNFVQGAVFGAPVSGMVSDGSLLRTTVETNMPTWWTGGSFGPEGSLCGVAVGLAIFLITTAMTKKSIANKFLPAIERKSSSD